MPTDDEGEITFVRPEDIAWHGAALIQVKRYEVGRRMELDGTGPLKSLPLLGSVKRWSVEVIHKDGTWDRTHILDSPVEAHRLANEMAIAHELAVKVVV